MSDEHRIAISGAPKIDTEMSKIGPSASALQMYAISQENAEDSRQWVELATFNPLAMARRFESLEVRTRRRGKEDETERTEKKDKVPQVQKLEEVSEEFQRKNPELQARSLLNIRVRISRKDTKDEILKKVLDVYSDYSLADEVLDFLLETADAELAARVKEAKEELHEKYHREIIAGKNIAAQARAFAQEGLGTATGLRDMYRDITGNPRDATTLFEELSNKFPFEKMKSVIDFILHSLGADLKSKGPSIDRAELYRLVTEGRTLQAILGVFRFFKSRMRLVSRFFSKNGLTLPIRINYELLSRQFVKFLQERYPTSDKVLLIARYLDIPDDLLAEIIIFTQYRDAIRQVAPKLFRSEQHRHDVLTSFLTALEDLEEKLEEEQEEEEEKEDKKKEGEKTE